ncbi:GAF and ANTAR domain-containing protein [Amycolatopsis marina]|nr:GAF and ANTAR domain-containing protein [Amycolatopsis marina]
MEVRTDASARPDQVTAALEELRARLLAEEPLERLLRALADTVVLTLSEVEAVSITLLSADGPYTVTATDAGATGVDQYQYTAGAGPCLDAATHRRVERGDVHSAGARWPGFAEGAARRGFGAYLSVPLVLEDVTGAGGELAGSLNVYGRSIRCFDDHSELFVRGLAATASAAICNALRWHGARREAVQLETALESRPEIERAKGVLMAVHGCTAEEAFARLADKSQRTNTKLFDIARELLASLRT